jgi:hypothetical protein
MHEAFLYYIWKFRLFDTGDLHTTSGEKIQILHPGYRNDDSGPDFFNARIRVDGFLWAGNVEVHVKASDWHKHGHTRDKAFDNIILHVVYEADIEIRRDDGNEIPVLCLKGLYPDECWQNYLDLVQGSNSWVPCERSLTEVPELTRQQWFDRLLVERIEERTNSIKQLLNITRNNWEESFYRHLSRSFGFRVNNVPFELLATTLPLTTLGRHRDQLIQVEALLFGQAGFLENATNDYYILELKKEFKHLQNKFGLQPMSSHLWKFGRLRPANFPTIRIAQFAMLLHLHERLFDRLMQAESYRDLFTILDVSPSGYWNRHYSFEAGSEHMEKRIGRSSIESLLINTIAPFTFYFGKFHQQEQLTIKAIAWLERCRPENNLIIRGWEDAGIKSPDAYTTQALIQLKKSYCDFKKCVNCGIGQYLLQHP